MPPAGQIRLIGAALATLLVLVATTPVCASSLGARQI